MAQNVRMTPPIDGLHNSLMLSSGQVITSAPGSFVDVPAFQARLLEANNWTRIGGPSTTVGPTSARPLTSSGGQPLIPGQPFIDTTIGAVVTWVPPTAKALGAWVHFLTGAPA